MDKTPATDIAPELSVLRHKIDGLDDKIIALLLERMGIVEQVGSLKRATAPGQCPIRPGREATMVRDIIKKFEDESFLPAAAAAIWRIIIGMSTSVESALKISVFTPDRNNDLYWLAREYFGPFIPTVRHPQVKRVIGDVIDGKAAVGIVPVPHGSDTDPWWTSLIQQGDDVPKVFACIPFVYPETPARDAPRGLAIARIAPEPSGDDVSLLVLEAEDSVSQNRLQTALATANLEANWIAVAAPSPRSRHHLIEIKGFITPEHPDMIALLAALGGSIVRASFLGAYAVPVIAGASQPQEHYASAT